MRITFNSPVTLVYSLLAAVLYFVFQTDGDIPRIFTLHGDFQWANWKWYISLIGYTLGHGSVTHLISNLSIILLLGPIVERRYGPKRLILMITLTAIVTALVHILFWDHFLIGASGVVFMMIVLSSLVNIRGNEIPFTFILIVLLFIGQELLKAFQDDQISQFAHIAGGILGMVFGFQFKSKGAA